MSSRLYLVAVIAASSVAQARAADDPAGYLISAQNSAPVTSAYGCVRTSQWTPDMSFAQCDQSPAVEAQRAVPFRISMDALFDFDSAVLSADAGPTLDGLVKQLGRADYQTVKIVGHADRIGRAKYNQQLSERRAEAVRAYLVTRGIDGSRIAVSGLGSSESVTGSKCEDLEGQPLIACLQPDRSAEVRVIGTQTSAMR
jgi:OmpA-OmpF porin, OOP family